MQNDIIEVEMIKTVHLLKRAIDEKISTTIDKDLTLSQVHIIGFLSKQNRDIFQKDIEKSFDLQRSSVSLMISNMEKNGFVVRESVGDDARLKKITLTQKALQLQEKIDLQLQDVQKKITTNISDDEQKIFLDILAKIKHNIQ